jgi:Leucine carboxyl methyltransferase
MALSRAIETRKPAAERIYCDPLAERFLGAKYRMLLWGRPFRDVVERLIERRFAGHHYYVVARTRYFDDFLQQRLASGRIGRPAKQPPKRADKAAQSAKRPRSRPRQRATRPSEVVRAEAA